MIRQRYLSSIVGWRVRTEVGLDNVKIVGGDFSESQLAGAVNTTRLREEEIDNAYQERISHLESSPRRSFLERSEALGRLTDEREKAATTRLVVSLLFILVELVPVLMKIIAPVDSPDRLAVTVRDAFAQRIPQLAQNLLDPGSPPPPPAEARAVDDAVGPNEAPPGTDALHRNIVILTALITGGMLSGGATLEQSFAAGSLFATVAPFLKFH